MFFLTSKRNQILDKMFKSLHSHLPKKIKQFSRVDQVTLNILYRNKGTRSVQVEYAKEIEKLQNYKGRIYPSLAFTKIDVRWGDQDAMNHVNNIKYFQFLEQARVNSFPANLPLSAVEAEVGGANTLPILARAEVSYKRPVMFPDTLLIGISSEAIDKNHGDFRHYYIIYSTAQEKMVSTGEADLVAYDYKEKKRKPVPDDWVF